MSSVAPGRGNFFRRRRGSKKAYRPNEEGPNFQPNKRAAWSYKKEERCQDVIVPCSVVNAIADEVLIDNPPAYKAWPLYFPCLQCSESGELCQLVACFLNYLKSSSEKTPYTYETLLCKRQFTVDMQTLLTSIPDDLANMVNAYVSTNADHLVACMALAMHQLASEQLEAKLTKSNGCTIRLPKLNARFYNMPTVVPIASIDFNHVGSLISFVGVVIRATACQVKCKQMAFECTTCKGHFRAVLTDGLFFPPAKCSRYGCAGKVFEPLVHSTSQTETVDYQQLRVQELNAQSLCTQQGQNNFIPKCIECDVTNDLVGYCSTGSVVTITGVVKMKKNEEARKRNQWQYALYVDVNQIVVKKGLFSVANCIGGGGRDASSQEKELKIVYDLLSSPNLFARLVASLCPTIYGEEVTKAGLVLALFGGSTKEFDLNRTSIHVFIVGDPGLGKTHLLRACSELSPNGVYVCASSATAAGLTVACSRAAAGENSLEAGALVIANDGCCCIDELDKMAGQHKVLLEVMEQQEVSVFKAGTQCHLPARVAILAASNPVQGHYNRQATVVDNLKINNTLLSRFDLIFLLLDDADAEKDRRISAHVIQLRGSNTTPPLEAQPTLPAQDSSRTSSIKYRVQVAASRGAPVSTDTFRKYIAFCRQMAHPHLNRAAGKLLASFYEQLVVSYAGQGLPAGIRQMESLIRLTQARARCELRQEAGEQDALDVIEIVRHGIVSKVKTPLQSGSGKVSKRQMKTANLVQYLCRVVESSEVNRFTTAQLKEAAAKMGLESSKPFALVIKELNEAGILLMKASDVYELNRSVV